MCGSRQIQNGEETLIAADGTGEILEHVICWLQVPASSDPSRSTAAENTFQKLIRHKGVEYQTDILDTAGQDEFQIFHTRYAMGIHGYEHGCLVQPM